MLYRYYMIVEMMQDVVIFVSSKYINTRYNIANTLWHQLSLIIDSNQCKLTLYDGKEEVYRKFDDFAICQLSLSSVISIVMGSNQSKRYTGLQIIQYKACHNYIT